MEGTREGCGLFCSLKLPYFSAMSQQFTHKNRDFGAFAKTNGNHTATKPSQPMAPAQCSMCVNNLFQLCATAVHYLNWTQKTIRYSVNIILKP